MGMNIRCQRSLGALPEAAYHVIKAYETVEVNWGLPKSFLSVLKQPTMSCLLSLS